MPVADEEEVMVDKHVVWLVWAHSCLEDRFHLAQSPIHKLHKPNGGKKLRKVNDVLKLKIQIKRHIDL